MGSAWVVDEGLPWTHHRHRGVPGDLERARGNTLALFPNARADPPSCPVREDASNRSRLLAERFRRAVRIRRAPAALGPDKADGLPSHRQVLGSPCGSRACGSSGALATLTGSASECGQSVPLTESAQEQEPRRRSLLHSFRARSPVEWRQRRNYLSRNLYVVTTTSEWLPVVIQGPHVDTDISSYPQQVGRKPSSIRNLAPPSNLRELPRSIIEDLLLTGVSDQSPPLVIRSHLSIHRRYVNASNSASRNGLTGTAQR